ncbi:hypothetical protein SAMN05216296_0755 [Pseudomonas pohangensis]|jgi:hypothetical protein|uniref:Uncharacterized protein n=1 Tax=Pseudomonas pohangensis TaxID=364197 RepID=A0A1H2EHF5_9PSED|nr:hypothetical protein SAMN05216296_0755 [Pseudomonas pohangensis]
MLREGWGSPVKEVNSGGVDGFHDMILKHACAKRQRLNRWRLVNAGV